ncbi:DNA gyrase inhibitor YacG [Paroceanicella profunda]|uniref:DNA gyrase inhibitor YacG n=1 Tax=Paroceanicella profunda TaxID=2579971 RepID=A0A5B8FH74_9RHOB|nr:DNA gyrase inhibitor YacG [Paroceanicella profunda]QDL91688.1 DNA gyrase inhibitor YacG [Paroceanicella profunda]
MSCPICARPTEPAYRPFCSKRCADVDLGRWLQGSYSIPAEEEEAPDDLDEETGENTVRRH